jgi:hypothetical protein
MLFILHSYVFLLNKLLNSNISIFTKSVFSSSWRGFRQGELSDLEENEEQLLPGSSLHLDVHHHVSVDVQYALAHFNLKFRIVGKH